MRTEGVRKREQRGFRPCQCGDEVVFVSSSSLGCQNLMRLIPIDARYAPGWVHGHSEDEIRTDAKSKAKETEMHSRAERS